MPSTKLEEGNDLAAVRVEAPSGSSLNDKEEHWKPSNEESHLPIYYHHEPIVSNKLSSTDTSEDISKSSPPLVTSAEKHSLKHILTEDMPIEPMRPRLELLAEIASTSATTSAVLPATVSTNVPEIKDSKSLLLSGKSNNT
jgi:hypothetical protein